MITDENDIADLSKEERQFINLLAQIVVDDILRNRGESRDQTTNIEKAIKPFYGKNT